METLLLNGKVKFFNLKGRFGFITDDATKEDYYYYIKNPLIKFEADDKVTFSLRKAKKGMEAVSIKKVDPE